MSGGQGGASYVGGSGGAGGGGQMVIHFGATPAGYVRDDQGRLQLEQPFGAARPHARKTDPYTSDQALRAIARNGTLMSDIWHYASEVRTQFDHPPFNDTMLTAWLEWHTGKRQQRNVVARSRGMLEDAGMLRQAGVRTFEGRELMHYEIDPNHKETK